MVHYFFIILYLKHHIGFEKRGGYNEALNDFNSLDLTDIKEIPNGKVGKLNDGRTVNVRSKSSDTRPTLEVYNPTTKSSIKIHYSY